MANYTAPDYDSVLAAVKGRNGIRTTKPKENGFAAYVWRMARFHSGKDVTMPVMADFDLANWAGHSYVHGDKEAFKKLRDAADKMADQVCIDVGVSNLVSAARWAKSFGYL